MSAVCRFRLPGSLDKEAIENQIALAIIAAEAAFGKPRVRINASYLISEERSQVVIDVSTDVGEHIAQVFTGLMILQVGEAGFTVDTVRGKECGAS